MIQFHLRYSSDETLKSILDFYAILHLRVSSTFRVIYYLTGCISFLYPVLVYSLTSEKILPFGFVIPGLDENKSPGYEINYLHHLFQILVVVPGLNTFQTFFIGYVINCCCRIDVLKEKLKCLNELLNDQDDHEREVAITEYLREIIIMHQDYNKYMHT